MDLRSFPIVYPQSAKRKARGAKRIARSAKAQRGAQSPPALRSAPRAPRSPPLDHQFNSAFTERLDQLAAEAPGAVVHVLGVDHADQEGVGGAVRIFEIDREIG